MTHKAVNWSQTDPITESFWLQNLKQFWRDEEFVPSEDIKPFGRMTPDQQKVFVHALGGLTLLDTKQGNVGMPRIAEDVEQLSSKSLLMFMGAMEGIHAKSYSTIFTTILNKTQISEVFDWVEENPYLQKKAEIIQSFYDLPSTPLNNYLRKVASVFLESFLFYSGFYYPLYLAGNSPAIMTNSAEIIALIVRDEAIHGAYVGMLAQQDYEELSDAEKVRADEIVEILLNQLMENEECYTDDLYSPLGLETDVKRFLRFNANQALMNLGKEQKYEDTDFSSIVFNGIDTSSVAHDFFSQKGNSYFMGNLVPITDKAFDYDVTDEFLIVS